jgi:hypothetical protein
MKYNFLFLLLFIISACGGSQSGQINDKSLETDVLIYGAGAAGTSAAVQAARQGVKVVLVEPEIWLGGMLTSAGVSAIDGNHELPSGLWGEFRDSLYQHYGGPEKVSTGWVSNTLFEPKVAAEILLNMVKAEPNITLFTEYTIQEVSAENNKVTGATFLGENGSLKVNAKISIDGSELGDLLGLSGANYFVGEDPKIRTGEALAPEVATDQIQDLTYVAILKDYGEGVDKTIPKPANYDPTHYPCPCVELCADTTVYVRALHECDKMLTYTKLPNDKYMINWPISGNDYYVNALEMKPEEREAAYQIAKEETLGFVYYIQTEAGYTNLGLAEDEFPTEDNLAIIPYHRESRRLDGVQMVTVNHLQNPYEIEGPMYPFGISVGDYPLDHHRDKGPVPVEIDFPMIPSFSIPYGSLVPKTMDGLLVSEKSISTSSLANGSTRLQPCVITIGQATGAAAALCVKQGIEPRALDVRELQSTLLEADCWILPYFDIKPESPYFKSLQKVGAAGLIKSEGVPYQWANRTYIYPDSAVSADEFVTAVNYLFNEKINGVAASKKALVDLLTNKGIDVANVLPSDWSGENMEDILLRKELAWIIVKIKDPFAAPLYLTAASI